MKYEQFSFINTSVLVNESSKNKILFKLILWIMYVSFELIIKH